MNSRKFSEGMRHMEGHRWDPVANGIRCYAMYHGLTEDDSRAVLDRYGLLEDLSDHGFSYEYDGARNEVMVLRDRIEKAGGMNPPMMTEVDVATWNRTLGNTRISTETSEENGMGVVRMKVMQGSCDYRIDMYPDGSVEIVTFGHYFLPLSKEVVEAFMEEWNSRISDPGRPPEDDRPRRDEVCPDSSDL